MLTLTCVDRGGTFTDVVRVDADGSTTLEKVPSDRAVVGDLARGTLYFGTTVATNALLERRTVRTLLLVTEGFADLVRIRDMTRPSLFAPDAVWPEPLCTRVGEVGGRLSADGAVVEELRLPDPRVLAGMEAVAIALLHSPRNPEHERAVARWVAEHSGAFVALGHELCPAQGYLARVETTLVDAAVTPILRAAMARDHIPPEARAVRSDGSWCPAHDLRAPDAILSGPASGVLAVAAIARAAGAPAAIGLDMGGTSTDVCVVGVGEPPVRDEDVFVAGVTVRRPMLEVETIAAGGGSILWSDGVRFGVGPRSAGADPGPQCTGRGGPPTLTDATLVSGGLDPTRFHPPLDPAKVALPGPAEEFLAVARAQMADAIRRLTSRRGLDPAEHVLVAFGGAAGQHAAGVAEQLGVERVLVHPAAGVLCAWGQALTRRQERAVRSVRIPSADLRTASEELERLARTLPALGEQRRTVGVRHQGTELALEVVLGAEADERSVLADFTAAHRARYGFDRALPAEIAWVAVTTRAPPDPLPALDDDPFGLGEQELEGPLRLDSPTTSVSVPPGWRARRRGGLLELRRSGALPPLPDARTPAAVAVWSSRFRAVASDAGTVLERTARSVNIRDRRDFSCAIFDADGTLIANAPHVPVHLGAMGETVRDWLVNVAPRLADGGSGQHWLCNDPAAGGSHLPDLTVITPVCWDGVRMFVANRGHHVDVGGITPGSMPPRSRTLAEEGFVVRHLPLLDGSALRADLVAHLTGCREPEVVAADLEAQIAANVHAARALVALGPGPRVARWAAHLLDVAEESFERVLRHLPLQHGARAADTLDGVELTVELALERGRLTVDFAGTGGPHPGNLNAPRAVVRAAVLYVLAVLAEAHGITLPLNEGVLRRVEIHVPPGSILDPPEGAAVAGGNVETSQRLVDLLLAATGFAAPSAGTMSNLTLGGSGWSLYETIGGGQGGSPRGPGPSGRQLHMTNTRATDPEILEARLPLRVRSFHLRRGSGGDGVHQGGEGLVRRLQVLAPATAALLASRRERGPAGLGGDPGAAGEDRVCLSGRWQAWDGEPIALQPGDEVEVATPGGGGWSPIAGQGAPPGGLGSADCAPNDSRAPLG